MSAFGGHVHFGPAQFGGDPIGLTPSFAIDRMLAALDSMHVYRGGVLRTLDILSTAPEDALAALQLVAHAGLPAVMIGYTGGPFLPLATTGMRIEQTMNLSAIVAADSLRGRNDRLAGRSIYAPGLWQLMRWVAFKCGRAINRLGQGRHGSPLSESFIAYADNVFVGRVDFQVSYSIDLYDDTTTLKLERLGITHTPLDLTRLFENDNETPYTDDPTSPGPGVAEL